MKAMTIYDRAMSGRYDADFTALFGGDDRGDLPFFLGCARETRGPVCEVGAGTGRVVLSLAGETGRRLINAIEPSEGMRAVFSEKCAGLAEPYRKRVRVLEGGFLDIPLRPASQGFVFAAFRSFQHLLTVEEQLAGLAEMRRVMAPGGLLALDFFDPNYALLGDDVPTRGARYRTAYGTVVERWESRRVSRLAQRVDVTFRWIERSSEDPRECLSDTSSTYSVRYTFPQELRHLLARAGFRDVELAGGYDGRPLVETPRELVVKARKARARVTRGTTAKAKAEDT